MDELPITTIATSPQEPGGPKVTHAPAPGIVDLDEVVVQCPVALMTLPQVATYLVLSPKTVLRMVQQGKLKGYGLGCHKRFRPEDVELLLKPIIPDSSDLQTLDAHIKGRAE